MRLETPVRLSVSPDNVKAVVLAAGKGVRMKSERPKVLHEILGRPVLDFVLRNLRLAGVQDIIVVVGHQADKVRAAANLSMRSVVSAARPHSIAVSRLP